jgi:hypothetical protein
VQTGSNAFATFDSPRASLGSGPFLTLFQVSATSEHHVAENTFRGPATRRRNETRRCCTESVESQ